MKLFILVVLLASLGCAPHQLAETEAQYVITEHAVIARDGIAPEHDYTITYGTSVFKVRYTESQTSSAKPGDFPGSGLHYHSELDPDLSQVPSAGVRIRACALHRDDRGELIIATQQTPAPCMASLGSFLQYEPSPNGPELFTYVRFDIVSEKAR